jgi:hypothetical protein
LLFQRFHLCRVLCRGRSQSHWDSRFSFFILSPFPSACYLCWFFVKM